MSPRFSSWGRVVNQPRGVAFPRVYPDSVVLEIVDGDSVRVDVDLGFDLRWKVLCRLHGIAAREKNRPGGPEARAHLAELIPPGTRIDVLSIRWDKYSGRIDAKLVRSRDYLDVNTQMVWDGYAAVWDGKGAQPEPVWPIPSKEHA
jgi:endonuclease YncB( thermonuclease family)